MTATLFCRMGVVVLGLVGAACCHTPRPATSQAPARFAWDGFACVPVTRATTWDSFDSAVECAHAFAGCPATPRAADLQSEPAAKLNGALGWELTTMRRQLGTDAGFLAVHFSVVAPLDDKQRHTLRCYGVVVPPYHDPISLGAWVSRKALAAFVVLPFIEQAGLQRDVVIQ